MEKKELQHINIGDKQFLTIEQADLYLKRLKENAREPFETLIQLVYDDFILDMIYRSEFEYTITETCLNLIGDDLLNNDIGIREFIKRYETPITEIY